MADVLLILARLLRRMLTAARLKVLQLVLLNEEPGHQMFTDEARLRAALVHADAAILSHGLRAQLAGDWRALHRDQSNGNPLRGRRMI